MASFFIYIERCSNDNVKILYIAVLVVRIQRLVFFMRFFYKFEHCFKKEIVDGFRF